MQLEEMERKVRRLAASNSARAVDDLSDNLNPQEDTVISVRRVTWPTVRLRYQIRELSEGDRRLLELVLRPDRPAWLPEMELRTKNGKRLTGRGDPPLARVPAGPVGRTSD